MRKAHIFNFILLIAVCAFFGCKKQPKPAAPEEKHPYAKPHGTVTGTPLEKSIGPEGGTITTTDGSILLTIPQGAVEGNVNISVQEVTSTVGQSGVGKSFRLLPENVQFKKDIEIAFKIPDSVIVANGTKLAKLRMAYQDEKGLWRYAAAPRYIDFSRTLIVKTKHFSDWTTVAMVKIINLGESELRAKEHTDFKVLSLGGLGEGETDDLIAPAEYSEVDEWKMGMPEFGTIVGDKQNAKLTAADEIPFPAEINGTAYFKTTYGREFLLTPPIMMLPKMYVFWRHDKGPIDWSMDKDDNTIKAELFKSGEFKLDVRSNLLGSIPLRLEFQIKNLSQGRHEFNTSGNWLKYTQVNRTYYQSGYVDCTGKSLTTTGTILITGTDGAYIEGEFQGNVRVVQYCNKGQQYPIQGRFRVLRPPVTG